VEKSVGIGYAKYYRRLQESFVERLGDRLVSNEGGKFGNLFNKIVL
jgi:hypothetical protein